jgi:hypothetical protein
MCEKCKAIDAQIATCERLKHQVTDKLLIDGLANLLSDYSVEKAALHAPQLGGSF